MHRGFCVNSLLRAYQASRLCPLRCGTHVCIVRCGHLARAGVVSVRRRQHTTSTTYVLAPVSKSGTIHVTQQLPGSGLTQHGVYVQIERGDGGTAVKASNGAVYVHEWARDSDILPNDTHMTATSSTVPPVTGSASPPVAALLYVHGLNDYSARLDPVAAQWTARGMYVAGADFAGHGFTALPHGQAAGESVSSHARVHAHVPSLAAAVSDVQCAALYLRARMLQKYNTHVPLVLVGASFGGTLALLAAAAYRAHTHAHTFTSTSMNGLAQQLSQARGGVIHVHSHLHGAGAEHLPMPPAGDLCECVCVHAPVITHPPTLHPAVMRALPAAKLLSKLTPSLAVLDGISGRAYHPSHASTRLQEDAADVRVHAGRLSLATCMSIHDGIGCVPDAMTALSNMPILVQHGLDDALIPASASEAFVASTHTHRRQPINLMLYPGAHHDLVRERPEVASRVAADMLDWICSRVRRTG